MTNAFAILAQDIRQALPDLERVRQRIAALHHKAESTGDDDYWDGIALNLHGFYSGVERILEGIAQAFDGVVPAGPDWHRQLLLQMSEAIPGLRPPVITPETLQCLDNYRGFRHVVRNIYAFSLRPERLQELVTDLARCHAAVVSDLTQFVAFLEQLVQAAGPSASSNP